MPRLLVESPSPHLRCRATATTTRQLTTRQLSTSQLTASPVRQAALAAAVALAVTSSGETLLLAIALGLAAADVVVGGVAGMVLAALAVRWGSASLDAIAGAQAVLGPGGVVGSAIEVASAWCGAAALVLCAPGGWLAVPLGAAAALGVVGPSIGGPDDLVIRVGGTAVGIALAFVVGGRLSRRLVKGAAVILGVYALTLAIVARRLWPWRGLDLSVYGRGLAVVVAAGALAVVATAALQDRRARG